MQIKYDYCTMSLQIAGIFFILWHVKMPRQEIAARAMENNTRSKIMCTSIYIQKKVNGKFQFLLHNSTALTVRQTNTQYSTRDYIKTVCPDTMRSKSITHNGETLGCHHARRPFRRMPLFGGGDIQAGPHLNTAPNQQQVAYTQYTHLPEQVSISQTPQGDGDIPHTQTCDIVT